MEVGAPPQIPWKGICGVSLVTAGGRLEAGAGTCTESDPALKLRTDY